MRVIHVLSQNELTGAEAYAITLIRRQLAHGHEVLVISDTLNLPLPEGATYLSMPIDRRGMRRRLQNGFKLRRLIGKMNPSIVHAHSRASSWVCRVATLGTGHAYVSTVHGRQHWHTRFKLNDIYGDRIIAICAHLRDHLIRDFGISPRRVNRIRNLIETEKFQEVAAQASAPALRLGIFGRLSGPKGRACGALVREVLPVLMAEFPQLEVVIGGGNPDRLSPEDRNSFSAFLANFPTRVRFFKNSPGLAPEIAKVDYVIGAGRIAVESLYSGKRVFGFGEHTTVGWINRTTLPTALPSNFGDVAPERGLSPELDPQYLLRALREGLAGKTTFDLDADDLRHYFGEDETYRQIQSTYLQAILGKRYPLGIPALMFHKVVSEPFDSPHRTFIEVARFEKLLGYLRGLGKETITFSDLLESCEGKRPFPKRPLLLTFDDGYRSTLELAAPLLQKFGMKAVLYLLADLGVETNNWDTRINSNEVITPLLSAKERREIGSSGVFEIGSHGLNHRPLAALSRRDREFEVTESKRLLEKEFGVPIHSYAYAYGNHTFEDSVTVNRSGYRFAVGTDSPFGLEENIFRIFRANIFPEDGFFSILKKSSVFYRHYFEIKRKIRAARKNQAPLVEVADL